MLRQHYFLAGLLIVYLVLASHNLDFLAGFVGDEESYKSAAFDIYAGGPATNLEHPLLAKTLQGLFAGLFVFLGSDPVIGMRVASLAAGAGVLIVTYALAARFISRGAACLAALLLFGNPLFLVHARLISPEMISIFFLMAAIYYFLDPRAAPLAGAFLGFSLSAKWIGIWLVPWALARLVLERRIGSAIRFFALLILFYGLGNAAYLMNHSLGEAFLWQKWALRYHQIHVELSPYNGSPAWTWFSIPQHLYYARLMPNASQSETVLSTINPVVWILVIPALWLAMRPPGRSAGRLLAEAAICLYVPWLFVARPTYFFYVLTLLPILAVLEASLLTTLWERGRKKAVWGVAIAVLLFFCLFYPAATGRRMDNRHEKFLAGFNFYKRPVFDSMFCQKCNLYFGEE